MSRGILYIAFGEPFLREMLLSIESVREFHPNLPITVFADRPVSSTSIDQTKIIKPQHLRPKIDHIGESPYQETLFLDTDTILNSSVEDMFEILPKYDIGLCQDLARKRKKYALAIPEYQAIPYAFPELNTGVILFRKNEHTLSLFTDWKNLFYKYLPVVPWDQPTFRVAIWHSQAKLHVFPTEYNVRSKANRKKQDLQHNEFGDDHLKPRIFHMHADPKIRSGRYKIKSLGRARNYCKKNFFPY